jgi:hypothetical protein
MRAGSSINFNAITTLFSFRGFVVVVAFCSEGCNADGRSDPSDNHSMRVDQSKQQCAGREEAAAEERRGAETENPMPQNPRPIVLLPLMHQRGATVKTRARSKACSCCHPQRWIRC